MSAILSRLGARFGNWNDRQFGPDLGHHPNRRIWRRLDQIASWLYVRPDRRVSR